MSDILCFTNRTLCREGFLTRVEKIVQARPRGLVLREKDLSPDEYRELAVAVLRICRKYNTPCILHYFTDVAREVGCDALHLPLPVLRRLSAEERAAFRTLGASCHSAEEASEAEALGCTYITAGHIFDTDCKQGLPGRGLDFLKEVVNRVTLPVYAIGGIRSTNIRAVRAAGAAGACIMRSAMTSTDPSKLLLSMEEDAHGI